MNRRPTVYVAHDPTASNVEEQDWRLVAAYGPRQAANIWLRNFGCTLDEMRPHVERAVWRWPSIPEPVPTITGIWWPDLFRGYGLWLADDPECNDCMETLAPGEVGDDGLCADCRSGQ